MATTDNEEDDLQSPQPSVNNETSTVGQAAGIQPTAQPTTATPQTGNGNTGPSLVQQSQPTQTAPQPSSNTYKPQVLDTFAANQATIAANASNPLSNNLQQNALNQVQNVNTATQTNNKASAAGQSFTQSQGANQIGTDISSTPSTGASATTPTNTPVGGVQSTADITSNLMQQITGTPLTANSPAFQDLTKLVGVLPDGSSSLAQQPGETAAAYADRIGGYGSLITSLGSTAASEYSALVNAINTNSATQQQDIQNAVNSLTAYQQQLQVQMNAATQAATLGAYQAQSLNLNQSLAQNTSSGTSLLKSLYGQNYNMADALDAGSLTGLASQLRGTAAGNVSGYNQSAQAQTSANTLVNNIANTNTSNLNAAQSTVNADQAAGQTAAQAAATATNTNNNTALQQAQASGPAYQASVNAATQLYGQMSPTSLVSTAIQAANGQGNYSNAQVAGIKAAAAAIGLLDIGTQGTSQYKSDMSNFAGMTAAQLTAAQTAANNDPNNAQTNAQYKAELNYYLTQNPISAMTTPTSGTTSTTTNVSGGPAANTTQVQEDNLKQGIINDVGTSNTESTNASNLQNQINAVVPANNVNTDFGKTMTDIVTLNNGLSNAGTNINQVANNILNNPDIDTLLYQANIIAQSPSVGTGANGGSGGFSDGSTSSGQQYTTPQVQAALSLINTVQNALVNTGVVNPSNNKPYDLTTPAGVQGALSGLAQKAVSSQLSTYNNGQPATVSQLLQLYAEAQQEQNEPGLLSSSSGNQASVSGAYLAVGSALEKSLSSLGSNAAIQDYIKANLPVVSAGDQALTPTSNLNKDITNSSNTMLTTNTNNTTGSPQIATGQNNTFTGIMQADPNQVATLQPQYFDAIKGMNTNDMADIFAQSYKQYEAGSMSSTDFTALTQAIQQAGVSTNDLKAFPIFKQVNQ